MNYLYPNYAKWQSRFLLMGTQLVINIIFTYLILFFVVLICLQLPNFGS